MTPSEGGAGLKFMFYSMENVKVGCSELSSANATKPIFLFVLGDRAGGESGKGVNFQQLQRHLKILQVNLGCIKHVFAT